jgi:hypothetical protein
MVKNGNYVWSHCGPKYYWYRTFFFVMVHKLVLTNRTNIVPSVTQPRHTLMPTLKYQYFSSHQYSQHTPLHSYPLQQSPPNHNIETAALLAINIRLNRPQPQPLAHLLSFSATSKQTRKLFGLQNPAQQTIYVFVRFLAFEARCAACYILGVL